MVRRILVAALLLAGGGSSYVAMNNDSQPVHGSYRGAYYQTAGADGGSYRGVKTTEIDTFKLLVQDVDYPNTAAADSTDENGDPWIFADSYYDTIYERSSAGNYDVRYGIVEKANASTVYTQGRLGNDYDIFVQSANGEDDIAVWSSVTRRGFVSFNTTGLEQGMKVESAYIYLNRSNNWSIPAGSGVWARLDTMIQDYAIFDEMGTVNPARFNSSWNEILDTANEAWSPTLASAGRDSSGGRDDMNDFGPRSDTAITSESGMASLGHCGRISVKTALQKYLDLGKPCGDVVLFALYGNNAGGTVVAEASAGNTAFVTSRGGNPALTVVATSKRGTKAWSDGQIPFALSFDDANIYQVSWIDEMNTLGQVPALSLHTNGMSKGWPDSLYSVDPTSFYIASHGRNEELIGGYTGQPLLYRLYRDWIDEEFTADIDTNSVFDFVWGGGAGERYSWEAISSMVDVGYRSGRADATVGANTKVGTVSLLSWSLPANAYFFKSYTTNPVFEYDGAYGVNKTFMRENIKDYADIHARGGDAAVFLHAHVGDGSVDTGKSNNYVSPYGLDLFAEILGELDCAKYMDYEDVLTMRIEAFMDPADITEANGYPADIAASAARSDSLQYETNDNRLRVWLAPRSN